MEDEHKQGADDFRVGKKRSVFRIIRKSIFS